MWDRRETLMALGAAALFPLGARGADVAAPDATADLAGDLAILRQALALHPGLYRYLTPAQYQADLTTLDRDWRAAADLSGRYLALSRFLATIRCGHSYANFFNQKRVVAAPLFDRPTRLPFHFVWIDRQMVVTADHSGSGKLIPGSRVDRINGIAPARILRELMRYARADGHNDAKRVALLEVSGNDSIEYFDVFQGLLFPPPGSEHQTAATLPDGRAIRLSVPAIDLKTRRAAMTNRTANQDGPIWDWVLRPDGIAVLTMPSWALFNGKWDWQAWLRDRLDSLTGAKGLIIDLRENEGGNDCGNPILARLIDRDLSPENYEQRVHYERTPASIDRYLDTWDDSFRTMGVGGKPLGDGFFARPGAAEDLTIKPEGKPLKLPVAALISPTNSSATFQFAQLGRQSGKVRLFGRTTGGNRRGINGGCFFFVRLPASGIEFDLPLVGYFPTTPQPDAGIDPDVSVAATAADIAAGRDPVMAAATDWINRA